MLYYKICVYNKCQRPKLCDWALSALSARDSGSSNSFKMLKCCMCTTRPAIKSSSSADTFTLWHLALKHYVTNVFYITQIYIPPVMKTGSANLIFLSSLSQLPLSNVCLFTADVRVFLFFLVFWLGICVEVDVDIISTTLLPHPHSPYVFIPTHNSLFKTSDSYLKSVRT